MSAFLKSNTHRMEQLQKNNKQSISQANSAYYIIIFLIIIFVLILIAIIFVFSNSTNLNKAALPSISNIPLQTLLYTIGGIVALFVIFVLVNSRYEIYFQKRPQIGINRPTPTYKVFWPSGKISEETLEIISADFPMTNANTYSISFEVMVSDTRSDDPQGPFRHLVHRGSKDIVTFKRNSPGSMPKGRGGLNDGLPSEMNPGIFVDQFTNDMILFIDTDPIKYGDYGFRESIRVSDIPLKKAFTVHLTIHDQILEVYINCRLAGSKVLQGIPRAVANNWYGLAGFSPAQAIVQNVKLWDIDLYATEIRNMCSDIQITKDAKAKAKSNCSKC
jgi:uncharacterized integral membrane protein